MNMDMIKIYIEIMDEFNIYYHSTNPPYYYLLSFYHYNGRVAFPQIVFRQVAFRQVEC